VPYNPYGLHHGTELRVIAKELRAMDQRKVLAQFRRELRAAAAPMVPAARAAALAIPAKGPKSTGLRKALAKSVKLSVRTAGPLAGVAVMADGRKMPSGEGRLPAYMEGELRWRHPVYGNRNAWVTQPPRPWFYRAVRPLGIAARVAVNRALNRIGDDITGKRRI